MENAGDAEVEEDTFVAGEEGLKGKRSRGVRGMSEGTMVVVNERMEKWNSLGRSSVKLGINSTFVEYFSTIDYTITVKWSASSRERLD